MTLTIAPILKSVIVKATAEHAFRVFTEGFDTWWPRSHHIGSSPMKRAFIEGFVGGRCATAQMDGTECPWGRVLEWDPPRRFLFAWQITPDWQFEPDVAKSSEVEVRFTPLGDGTTQVEVEHRGFERYGADGGAKMRAGVGGDGGWGSLLEMFKTTAERR